MCDQLANKARQEVQGWNELLISGETGPVPQVVDRFLTERLMPIGSKAAEHYNENKPLGDAIREAVAVGQLAQGWPEDLQALCQVALIREKDVALEEGASLKELVQWAKGPLALSLKDGHVLFAARQEEPSKGVVGLCALMWLMHVKGVSISSIDLSGSSLGADGLSALGRAVAPSLVSLNIDKSNCTNGGGDYSGLQMLCDAVRDDETGLKELRYAPVTAVFTAPFV